LPLRASKDVIFIPSLIKIYLVRAIPKKQR
jgi:hypothetical protein